MIVSAPSSMAWPSRNSSLRSLLPPAPRPLTSSRLIRTGGLPSAAASLGASSSGVGQLPSATRGNALRSMGASLKSSAELGVMRGTALQGFEREREPAVQRRVDPRPGLVERQVHHGFELVVVRGGVVDDPAVEHELVAVAPDTVARRPVHHEQPA